MNNQQQAHSGFGIGTLTFIVLLILKLTGNINMSWFWVISSIIWAPLMLFTFIVIIIGLAAIITILIEDKNKKKRW